MLLLYSIFLFATSNSNEEMHEEIWDDDTNLLIYYPKEDKPVLFEEPKKTIDHRPWISYEQPKRHKSMTYIIGFDEKSGSYRYMK